METRQWAWSYNSIGCFDGFLPLFEQTEDMLNYVYVDACGFRGQISLKPMSLNLLARIESD